MLGLHAMIAALAVTLFQLNAAPIQPGQPVTIPKGTKIYTKLSGAVNTADLQPNFPIVFEVEPPYPMGSNAFKGATILAFVSQVEHGSPRSRAGVGFIFDKINYANGQSRHIYCNVVGPGVKSISQPPAITSNSGAVNPVPGPTNLAGNPGGLGQPILWEAALAPQPFPQGNTSTPHDSTGSFAHARQNGTDVTVPAGVPVTMVLVRDLLAPAH
jgi:hypothetical protein